jgi:hypothetical protein
MCGYMAIVPVLRYQSVQKGEMLMRHWTPYARAWGAALAATGLLAACSGGGDTKAETEKAEAASQLSPGQWEVSSEVTRLNSLDQSPPAIDTPAGTRAQVSHCVGTDEGTRPPAAMLAGSEDECRYRDFYMSRGRINATMLCRRDGIDGDMVVSVTGTFTADSFEGERDLTTAMPGAGDVRILSSIEGRRTGPCTSPDDAAGNAAEPAA